MPKKKASTPSTDSTEPILTKEQIVRGATNSPDLSPSQFTLGDKVYTVVDLAYDDYLVFISMLEPILKALFKTSGPLQLNGLEVAPSDFSVETIIGYCSNSLPKMVQIVCKATDPNITIDEVKTAAKNPFRLAEIVLQQVIQNGIIKDFASFFRSVLPLLKQTTML